MRRSSLSWPGMGNMEGSLTQLNPTAYWMHTSGAQAVSRAFSLPTLVPISRALIAHALARTLSCLHVFNRILECHGQGTYSFDLRFPTWKELHIRWHETSVIDNQSNAPLNHSLLSIVENALSTHSGSSKSTGPVYRGLGVRLSTNSAHLQKRQKDLSCFPTTAHERVHNVHGIPAQWLLQCSCSYLQS
ncbi:unnamed protein product [Cercospora beticola]|nr:unnamed protein product [Cercospora beticola]